MSNSLFVQLFFVVLAGAIGFLYIEPTVDEIRATQDSIALYTSEREKIDEVNALLATQVATINSIETDALRDVERYLPTTVDEIAVMQDLETIVQTAGVSLTGLTYGGPLTATGGVEGGEGIPFPNLPASLFKVSITGSYEQFKELLRLLEQNDYLLEIRALNITPNSDGVAASLDLVTYALTAPEETQNN